MKKMLSIAAFAALFAGCASSSNQKIAAPVVGAVKNEYYIYNVSVQLCDATNAFQAVRILMKSANGQGEHLSRVKSLRGNELFAVDNQILVGRDIGNSTSNDVSGSISVPFSF